MRKNQIPVAARGERREKKRRAEGAKRGA
jgi:hypothetical protein